jgi:hypothetical protein
MAGRSSIATAGRRARSGITSGIERQPAAEDVVDVVVELIPFDEESVGPEVAEVSAAERAACPTLAELRERFGGERGWLTDPRGNEHAVVLGDWPTMDPCATRVLVRFHVVPDPLTAAAPAAAPRR